LWSEKRLSGEMLGEKAVTLSLSPTAAEMKPGVGIAIWAVADALPHSYYNIAEVNSRGTRLNVLCHSPRALSVVCHLENFLFDIRGMLRRSRPSVGSR